MFNQVVYSDNDSTLELYPVGYTKTSRTAFSDIISVSAVNGIFTVKDFTFYYTESSSINVTYNTTAIPTFSESPVQGLIIKPLINVRVNFRACELGEFSTNENGFTICQKCPTGFWNLQATPTSACTACDTSSTICRGGNEVGPRKGYWRLNETANLVIQCPVTNACPGNSDAAANDPTIPLDITGSCNYGYKGNLCNNCIHSWAKGTTGECVNCHSSVLSYFIFVVVVCLQFVFIAYGVKATMKEEEHYDKSNVEETNSAVLIRIFLNYSQMFSLLLSIPIDWPKVLNNTLAFSSKIFAIGDQVFSFDCFFSLGKGTLGVRIVFVKALLSFLNPVIFILLGLLFWIIYFKIKKIAIAGNRDFANKLITTCVIICFDMQPTIIKSSFSLLQCQNIYRTDNSLQYLVQDYDVKCWEGEHLRWVLSLVLPSLLLWVIVLPGLVIWILRKKSKSLEYKGGCDEVLFHL